LGLGCQESPALSPGQDILQSQDRPSAPKDQHPTSSKAPSHRLRRGLQHYGVGHYDFAGMRRNFSSFAKGKAALENGSVLPRPMQRMSIMETAGPLKKVASGSPDFPSFSFPVFSLRFTLAQLTKLSVSFPSLPPPLPRRAAKQSSGSSCNYLGVSPSALLPPPEKPPSRRPTLRPPPFLVTYFIIYILDTLIHAVGGYPVPFGLDITSSASPSRFPTRIATSGNHQGTFTRIDPGHIRTFRLDFILHRVTNRTASAPTVANPPRRRQQTRSLHSSPALPRPRSTRFPSQSTWPRAVAPAAGISITRQRRQ